MSWAALAGLGSAYLGYRAQRDANRQTAAQNELLKQQYEWQKSKEVPGVAGAKDALTDNAEAFQRFMDAQGRLSGAGINIAGNYLNNVGHYADAGLRGLGMTETLASMTPEQRAQLGDYYADRYGRGAYELAAEDINEGAQNQRRENAIRQGRFGALSSQNARAQGQIDEARTTALLQAAERAKQVGYDRSNAYLTGQQNLANTLTAQGSTGLSYAQQASQLGSGAVNAGIAAPFQPFRQYGQTVSAVPTANVLTYGRTEDPWATGLGLGIQAYSRFAG